MEDKRIKVKTIQIENKIIEYTHMYIPNFVTIKLSWKQILLLLIKRKFILELNVYMNSDKVAHIKGKAT